jgi:hypothetical protein
MNLELVNKSYLLIGLINHIKWFRIKTALSALVQKNLTQQEKDTYKFGIMKQTIYGESTAPLQLQDYLTCTYKRIIQLTIF